MKSRKALTVSLLVIALIFSSNPLLSNANTDNFKLTIIIPGDNQRIRVFVNLLNDYWDPLHIELNIVGFPEPTYIQNLLNPTLSWDLAIISFDGGEKGDPGLLDLYDPEYSVIAKKLFPFTNPDLLSEIGIGNDFLQLLHDAYFTFNKTQKVELLKTFQRKFNEEWLLNLPLFTKLGAVIAYRQLNGFNPQEGMANSIFSGMHWNGNAKRREDQGGTTDNLRLLIQDPVGSFNPLFTVSGDYEELNSLIFPQLMLFDENVNPYPDLAVGYNIDYLANGSSYITVTLRDDANWINKDGQIEGKIGVKDVKFTFDVLKFDWVPTVSNNLIPRIKSIKILNDTSIQFFISKSSPSDLYLIGRQHIVPEYLLNQTLTIRNEEIGTIYGDKISPLDSDQWANFASQPVSGSMYYFKSKRENIITLKPNPSYWYPTIDDIVTPTTWDPSSNKFFDWNDDPSTPKIEKPVNALINEITYAIIEDKSSASLQFHYGILDVFRSKVADSKNLYLNDEDLVNRDFIPKGYIETFLVNYENNQYLRDYRVRKALLAALNRTEILEIMGTSQEIQYSPISKAYTEYYSDQGGVHYDYNLARDLFREAGFVAEEYSTLQYSTRNINVSISLFGILVAIIVGFRKRKTTY